jgi:hypothetical protein
MFWTCFSLLVLILVTCKRTANCFLLLTPKNRPSTTSSVYDHHVSNRMRQQQQRQRQHFVVVCSSRSVTAATSNEAQQQQKQQQEDRIFQYLMDWFQGDFDNYEQVMEDRRQNMGPREGGGHEHFHCTLVPITPSSRLAAFYFDANPSRIFRFRHYKWMYDSQRQQPSAKDVVEDSTVGLMEMQLSTLHPHLEQLLRENSAEPLKWPALFDQFQPAVTTQNKIQPLPKCEVAWSLEHDPIQHSYTQDIPENSSSIDDANLVESSSLHAVMVYGEAIVNSTIVPGMAIRILDQLSLYPDVFYINDRGFDPLTGAYIYGNQRGVPYRLCRVATFSSHDAFNSTTTTSSSTTTTTSPSSSSSSSSLLLQRQVKNLDLAWTLGPKWRTEEEYEEKMNAIGGVSAGINKKSYQSRMTKVVMNE